MPRPRVVGKGKFVHASQVTGGSFEEAMHDVVIEVDGLQYWIPSVHGRTINRLENEGRLGELTKLSNAKRLTYVPHAERVKRGLD